MNRSSAPRAAATAAGSLLLVAALTGCNSEEPARPTALNHASPIPLTIPAEFCPIAAPALPNAWVLPKQVEDPYDLGARGNRATCTLSTGYESDQHTSVIVTWKPAQTAAAASEALVGDCARIGRIAIADGVPTTEGDGWCQGLDNDKTPEWTLLAYTDPTRSGVMLIRVDTTNPRHATTLDADTRRFAADVIAALPA